MMSGGCVAKASKKNKASARTLKRLSYKDVQIAYLQDGVPAVEKLLKDGRTNKAAVRKALEALRELGAAAATLDDFVRAQLGNDRRGRAAPLVGSERTYRAQQLETGSPFLRLPLKTLGVKKGSLLTVRFDRDQIIVSRS
jgi:hypothetical protein